MTKLTLAALAALLTALLPDLATAQSSPSEAAASVDKMAVTAAAAGAATDQPILGRYSESGALRLGASLGPDFFSSTTGFRIQGDAQYTLFEAAPQMYFDLAGQVAAVFASGVTILEAVPKARLRYAVLDPITLYGDAGLGLAFSSLSAPGGGSNTQVWGDLRFAGGVQYKLTPEWSAVLEPVGLNIYFGTNSSFHYSILAGFLYRVM